MTSTHFPPNWIERICAILNVHGWLQGQFPHQVIRFFTAWAQAEWSPGSGQPAADWNPLNSTEHVYAGLDRNGAAWQAATDFNGAHVCDYLKPTYGVMATAATLLDGNFNKLLGALQGAADSGITAEQIVQQHRDEISTWGTSPDLMLEILGSIA